MMKNLKKLTLLACALSLITVLSCDNEDKDDKSPANYVTIDGTTYDLDPSAGEVRDYGAGDTHYNLDFYMTGTDANVQVYLELFSLGTSGFNDGTFTQQELDASGNFYGGDEMTLDGGLNETDASGGSVTITDNGNNNYTIIFNYTEYEGQFSGTFEYIDRTN